LFVTPVGAITADRYRLAGKRGPRCDRLWLPLGRAGISKIDYVLITIFMTTTWEAPHNSGPHPGRTFIDHGENRETTDAVTVKGWQAYQALLATGKYQHISAKPGETLADQGDASHDS